MVDDGLRNQTVDLDFSAAVQLTDAFNFHTYEMRGTPGQTNHDFYIDGTFIQSVPFHAVAFDNVLFLGDATGGQNAAGDVTQFSFTQAAVIPEPQAYALLLAGLGLLGFTALRRNSGSGS